MKQGAESNLSGSFLERTIELEFRARGIPIFNWSKKGEGGDLLADRFVLRGVPYTSIYGCDVCSEFVYRHFSGRDIRIECRWQQVSGSVDEKFPYLFMNALKAMPENEIWTVIDGGGARQAAIDWFRRECSQVSSKQIRPLSLTEARQMIKRLAAETA
jgi:hypothetical protein